jgi:predicted membrane channel-forming protein YqfA (hemolysin III family)
LNETLFEVLFMMVILKIPIIYLCGVVWYACRAEQPPPEAVSTRADAPEPEPRARWERGRAGRRGRPRPGPPGAPPRRPPRREAYARGRVEP